MPMEAAKSNLAPSNPDIPALDGKEHREGRRLVSFRIDPEGALVAGGATPFRPDSHEAANAFSAGARHLIASSTRERGKDAGATGAPSRADIEDAVVAHRLLSFASSTRGGEKTAETVEASGGNRNRAMFEAVFRHASDLGFQPDEVGKLRAGMTRGLQVMDDMMIQAGKARPQFKLDGTPRGEGRETPDGPALMRADRARQSAGPDDAGKWHPRLKDFGGGEIGRVRDAGHVQTDLYRARKEGQAEGASNGRLMKVARRSGVTQETIDARRAARAEAEHGKTGSAEGKTRRRGAEAEL